MSKVLKLPHVKKKKKNCPFRKDSLFGWLGAGRMTEILNQDSFVCHKTTHSDITDRRQCAGHMIMAGDTSSYVRSATAMDINLELSGAELLFDTQEDCIKHHGGLA